MVVLDMAAGHRNLPL